MQYVLHCGPFLEAGPEAFRAPKKPFLSYRVVGDCGLGRVCGGHLCPSGRAVLGVGEAAALPSNEDLGAHLRLLDRDGQVQVSRRAFQRFLDGDPAQGRRRGGI